MYELIEGLFISPILLPAALSAGLFRSKDGQPEYFLLSTLVGLIIINVQVNIDPKSTFRACEQLADSYYRNLTWSHNKTR